MKKKLIKHPVRGVRQYVAMLNGLYDLTPTEIDVLAAFVELHLQMKHAGLPTNAFSADGRKIVAQKLASTSGKQKEGHTWLSSYIKNLKDKGVIRPIPGGYIIDEKLIPEGESEIIIRIK